MKSPAGARAGNGAAHTEQSARLAVRVVLQRAFVSVVVSQGRCQPLFGREQLLAKVESGSRHQAACRENRIADSKIVIV